VRETFGRTANLAWQLGVPVVAADHGALRERVREGRSGTLFVPGDARSLARALQRMLRDGILMQAEVDDWPPAADIQSCVEALLPLYAWRP
jgi:glycosyltransferase involved in cell wall biosynthesis